MLNTREVFFITSTSMHHKEVESVKHLDLLETDDKSHTNKYSLNTESSRTENVSKHEQFLMIKLVKFDPKDVLTELDRFIFYCKKQYISYETITVINIKTVNYI